MRRTLRPKEIVRSQVAELCHLEELRSREWPMLFTATRQMPLRLRRPVLTHGRCPLERIKLSLAFVRVLTHRRRAGAVPPRKFARLAA
jgi:hypothetical protein